MIAKQGCLAQAEADYDPSLRVAVEANARSCLSNDAAHHR